MTSSECSQMRFQWMVVLLVSVIQVSEELSVSHLQNPVRAKVSYDTVILPCEFSTETYETPQITWYQEKAGERRKIMQFDIHNRLSSYGEFVNRVARGDRGALVLLSTFPWDSGNYSCEVEVDNEIPSWVKTTVILDVEKESNDVPILFGTVGRIILLSILWLVPVICGVLWGHLNLSRQPVSRIEDARCTETFKRALFLAAVLGIALIITGVVFVEIAVGNIGNASIYNYYFVVSLITGLSGALVVVLLTGRLCLKKRRRKSQDTSDSPVSYNRSPGDDESAVRFIKNTDVISENTYKTTPASNVRTYKTPENDRITGMAWLNNSCIFVTTSSGLFELNVRNGDENFKKICTVNDNNELLSVENYRGGLIMCARKNGDNVPAKGYFLILSADKQQSEICLKNFSSSTILCSKEARADGTVYAVLSNPNNVIKKNLKSDTEDIMWNTVLSRPEYIVQTSKGQFIVADSVKNDLFVFKENGNFLTTVKDSMPNSVQCKLNGCNRLALDSDDRILASSPWSNDILVFSKEFKFEGFLKTNQTSSGVISCLLVHNNFLYVAFEICFCAYSLQHIKLDMERSEG